MNPISQFKKSRKAGLASFDALLASFTAVILLVWVFSAVSVSYARSAKSLEKEEAGLQKAKIADRLVKVLLAKTSGEAAFSHDMDEGKLTPALAESLREKLGLEQLRVTLETDSGGAASAGNLSARDCIRRLVAFNGEVGTLEVCT